MIDFESIIDYSLAGFGSGAVSYSVISAAQAAGASIPTPVGALFFGALTILGVVGGFLKGRSKYAAKTQ